MMTGESEADILPDGDVEMEGEKTYQRQLRLFTNASVEKGMELVKIGEILSGLRRRETFLDIGAGGGDLTIPLAGSFRKTTVVEPNSRQIAHLRGQRPEFECIRSSFAQADLGDRRFDFILCSHVLYYIHPGMWLPTVAKMHDHLAPGGRLVLVIQSPIGQVAEFFNAFASYDVPVLDLWKHLGEMYGEDNLAVRYFLSDIRTTTLDDMVDIGLFLLCDHRFRLRREEIAGYFRQRHGIPGGYRLVQDEILLSIAKSGEPGHGLVGSEDGRAPAACPGRDGPEPGDAAAR
ncbi:MAG: class I SAM-dependent methyltransferase [Desulfovibrionaceae bacterium]|nr:class I SAM-dependent methyltransferase [Desulfovibrionaceae bacterium]